jgi:2-polyprenyl-3-methyl-5-hydroxy-6-metoxy-1,4-benzoquinol methylase
VLCELCSTKLTLRRVGHIEMLLCNSCGLGRVSEMETAADYWTSESNDQLDHEYWTVARSGMFEKALIHLETSGGKGRVVDIGGGVGRFAECALQRGWDAYSCDLSPTAREAAARRLGAERSLAPDDLSSLEGTADVVTLWCVIAHVLNPADLVRQAVDLLKPGGRLLLTTPNFVFQRALARVLAKLGRHYDLASRDHVLHFTPLAIETLLGQAGLNRWTFEYLGVTDYCVLSPRHARVLVPLKRIWNRLGAYPSRIGLSSISAELQVVASKPRAFPEASNAPSND